MAMVCSTVLALICWNLLPAYHPLNTATWWTQTNSKELSLTRSLQHLAYLQPCVQSDFVPHLIPLYHTTVFWSILYNERTLRDPGGSWLLHWSDVVMITEGTTFMSKNRALPKPINYSIQSWGPYQILTYNSIQSEGLTKLPHSDYAVDGLTIIPHSWALWKSLPQS